MLEKIIREENFVIISLKNRRASRLMLASAMT